MPSFLAGYNMYIATSLAGMMALCYTVVVRKFAEALIEMRESIAQQKDR